MPNEVVLSTKIDLEKAIESLQRFHANLDEVSKGFKATGDDVEDQFNANTKKTESFLQGLSSMAGRVSDQIRKDFKSLISIESLGAGLKISEQFKGSVRETISLSDSIRKLGGVFGIASKDFSSFQTTLTKGLGDIGMSSEVAARTLEGLSKTQVRGTSQITEYSKAAGMLASIGKQQGHEGDIAESIAKVIEARGGNVNDMSQMQGVSQDVLAVHQATGASPTETLKRMESMFTDMSSDFRKSISSKGLATLAGASGVAGPNATSFVESYLKMGQTQRAGLSQRGVGNLFSEKGFDPEQVKKFAKEAEKLGGGDMRLGLKAMGIESDAAAEGFIRLVDKLHEVMAAQEKIQSSTADLGKTYQSSLGLSEAFEANINKVKKAAAGPLSMATQGLTGALGKASESTAGSAAVVAGAGILAAVLTGGGLRGVGKGLAHGAVGMAKSKAEEAITGEKVLPVRVVNVSEFGGGVAGAAAAAGSGVTGRLAKAGGVVAGAAAVIGAGNEYLQTPAEKGGAAEGLEGATKWDALFAKVDQFFGTERGQQIQKAQKVIVELNERQLKDSKPGSRGASH